MGVPADPMRAALFAEPEGVDAINVRGGGRRETRRCRRWFVGCLIFGVASGLGVFAYWRVRMGMCTAAPTPPVGGGGPRRIKWYVSKPDDAQGFLLGDNPEGVMNSHERVSDITGGMYHLGNQLGVNQDGQLCLPWLRKHWSEYCPPSDGDPTLWANRTWNASFWANASVEMWQTIAGPTQCHAALRRGDGFVDEVHRWAEAYSVAGIFVDWEWGVGNDVQCFVQLWARVAARLHAHGRKLAINVDNSGGEAFRVGRQTYSYMNDWGYFFDFADLLVNQGTYPGPWASRTCYPVPPVGSPMESYTCEVADPWSWGFWTRCCGIKGQVRDFALQARAGRGPPMERVEQGLWASPCSADGTAMVTGGWTRESLRSWLEYIGASGVRSVAVFTDNQINARPLAPIERTCAWVLPELRRWALAGA